MHVLVVNAGSSSLKVRLLGDADEVIGTVDLPADTSGFDVAELSAALNKWPRPQAVGHRFVHGGTQFSGPARIDDEVMEQLRGTIPLAPLHQPKSLAGVEAVTQLLPDVPAVACFDTAFHTTLAPGAYTYAVPAQWRETYGIRRYGFHGLSHAYASARAAALAGRPVSELRTVVCHLGAGASLCAVAGGNSVDTTMGFTPLEGLVMATRSGTVDPNIVLWLQQQAGLSVEDVAQGLEREGGLLALSGSNDMRDVEDGFEKGDERSILALETYVHRLISSIGSMIASAGGIDALVFTGGVGEHSPIIRGQVATALGWAGLTVDSALNEQAHSDLEISAENATARTFVITAREDLQISGEVRGLLG
ncbi:acetate/propionate family kinase [Kineosporia sp. NBRC 101731]|uniref:acetate/propionate family kinase n=1 Tax=Kineosporia sp. NBRC 101731 TaxID=3032199 RepID=UPI0024A0C6E4|nr:acetate/propionate family kinase [Kineosporia sp. NBRC 101731]GLY27960.1 acetate kinase [Kineosporia sp. NBRC 101731]